jgi:hypothetical protein
LIGFTFIFASLVESTWSLRMVQNGRPHISARLDATARWTFPLAFFLLTIVVIHFR